MPDPMLMIIGNDYLFTMYSTFFHINLLIVLSIEKGPAETEQL